MGKLFRPSLVAFTLGMAVLALVDSGCLRRQMLRREEPDTKRPGDVLAAAESVIKEHYYQVKVYPRSNHLVALTPIYLEGNQPVRKKIDVWVFQENGYYMPKVFVRRYVDIAEPSEEGGLIAGRFPTEVGDNPVATDDWHPLYYDRTEEQELRNAILHRLNLPKA